MRRGQIKPVKLRSLCLDAADEMMAYTKNNILIQSAQAMLAQIVDGTLTVDGSDVPEPASTDNVTVNIVK